MFLIRLLLLPFKIAFAVARITFRVGRRVGTAPLKVPVRVFRMARLRTWIVLAIGVAIGLLFAPQPGRELREKLRRKFEGGSVTGTELVDKVAFELSHAPRTWHLPQPEVRVDQGRVTLVGAVKESVDADELARIAAAVPGVTTVDNQLEVTGH